MNLKRILPILIGSILFLGGVAVSLSLSAVLLWGEMEARLYTQQSGAKSLKIGCPLIIAPWESALVDTVITNTLTDQAVKPQVNAIISREGEARLVSRTLELIPLDSQPLEWTVDSSDVIFERLILVNILQRPYRDLPSRQGACSILVFSLFGRNGRDTLRLLVSAGTLSLLGAGFLYYLLQPFTEFTKKLAQLLAVFLCLVLAGLLSALQRAWGLTLLLDGIALLALTAGGIEIFFSPKK